MRYLGPILASLLFTAIAVGLSIAVTVALRRAGWRIDEEIADLGTEVPT